MRTLSEMPAELSNLELGLELELNSEDVAAAEAAVAAHAALFTCSCCNQELSDKESLHLHQISQHSISQLSIALLSLRGFDVSSRLQGEGSQEVCRGDSESESTVSAHSSFMCGFTDEFNSAVREVCALNGPDMSSGTDMQSAPLSNAPQYSSDCAGTFCYGGNNTRVDGHSVVDVNSNLHSKVGSDATDLIESIAQHTLLTNSSDMLKVTCNQSEAALLQDFCESEVATIQPKFGKNSKRVQANKTHQATVTSNRGEVTLKKQNLTCGKSTAKDSEKRQAGNDCDRREFPCEICGRKYKRKSHLGRHIRMHSGVRPFACTVCDKRFAVRSILKQHMRVHTGERPFKCHFCSQGFPQKSGLVTHMMLHTGKPYKCDLCTKSFVSNHKLSVHKRSHEEQSGQWPALGPHSCPTCSTRFFTNSALLEHANVHIGAPLSAPPRPTLSPPTSSPPTPSPSIPSPPTPSPPTPSPPTPSPPTPSPPTPSPPTPSPPTPSPPTPSPLITEPVASNDSHDESADTRCTTTNHVNMNTHNPQEVTAGQALLTLMDSNLLKDDPGSGEGDTTLEEDNALSEKSECENASDVVIDFEFCDVPLDLKPCIYLKEECFEIDNVLDKSSKNNIPHDK